MRRGKGWKLGRISWVTDWIYELEDQSSSLGILPPLDGPGYQSPLIRPEQDVFTLNRRQPCLTSASPFLSASPFISILSVAILLGFVGDVSRERFVHKRIYESVVQPAGSVLVCRYKAAVTTEGESIHRLPPLQHGGRLSSGSWAEGAMTGCLVVKIFMRLFRLYRTRSLM